MFANTDFLVLALVLPILVGSAVWLYYRRRKRVAAALGDSKLLARLGGGDLTRFPTLRLLLLTLAALALGLAAAEPRWGMRDLESRTQSRSIVFALDISKSMNARDVLPNRLERERVLARRVLRELASDRIGLVVFAGRAYILSPLTTDHGALQLYVDALDPEMVSQGGSSLASALGQAVDLARGPTGRTSGAAVVVVSDGEALEEEGSIAQAIRQANRYGVVVHTVGIGTEEGARIPEIDPRTHQVTGYKTDPYGEVVVTKLDEKALTSVASQTGGKYFRLDQAGATSALMRELKTLERSSGEQRRRTEKKDQSIWFVLAALLFLVADHLFARPRTKERRARPVRRLSVPGKRVAAVLILLSLIGWGIGQVERGNRHYRAGRYAEAVREYEAALKSGVDTPELHYNLGTALLQLGREDEAEQHLQVALRSRDAALRQRAYFNTGYRALNQGRRGGEDASQRLDAAIENYKRSLRLDPTDRDAKWNLELAIREQEKQKQNQGGSNSPQSQGQNDDQKQRGQSGAAGQNNAQSSAGQGRDQGNAMQQRPMSREQADRILSAIEQDERQLTREKLRKGQRRTPVARDW
jgi:Ca-activated chloride channel homolog